MTVPVLGDAAHPSAPHLGRRERALLAALVLLRPHVATPETLADAVWGESPPSTWPKQLQASVGRLRRAYGTAAIETVAGGYRLTLPDDAIDVSVFEATVGRGRGYARDGEHDRAVATLERALSLWRGAPYQAIEEWPEASAEISRITELKLSTEDDLLLERLATGDHRTVAASGAAAVEEQPLREARWIALATALYRCDQQADALAALRRAGSHLRHELGLDPSPAMAELQARILRHDAELREVAVTLPAADDCPYKGLAAYGPGDADSFFGRDVDIAHAVESLDRTRLVVLAGASGSGKSSLLRAGIAPVHRARGIPIVESSPDVALTVWEPQAPPDALVIVDHLEVLFTPGAPTETARMVCASLAEHCGRGGRVAIGMRSDALDGLAADPELGPLLSASLHVLTPMRADEMRQVIEKPAALARLSLEHGFTDVVLADAADAVGTLPLLSHALAETWVRREGSTLTIDAYAAAGGLRGAVARSAERVYDNLTPDDRRRCSMIFRRLVQLTETGNVTAATLDWRTLTASGLDAVARRLVAARLLVSGGHHIELTHESIVRAWPRLLSWLEADVEGQRVLSQLAVAASTWDELGRPQEELLRGPRLALASDWAQRSPDDVTRIEHDFLTAARELESSEQAAAEAERQREERTRARTRRLRAGVLSGAVAAIASVGIAVVAFQAARASGAAETVQRDRAQLEALVGDSVAQQSTSRETALLLAVEAYLRWPRSREAQGALLSAFQAEPGFLGNVHLPDTIPPHAALLPDGRHAVLSTPAGLEIRDVTTGASQASIRTSVGWDIHEPPLVFVDPSGTRAVTAGHRAACTVDPVDACVSIAVYDLISGKEESVEGARGLALHVNGTSLSPDGRYLATVNARTGTMHINEVSTGAELVRLAPDLSSDRERDPTGAVTFVDSTTAVYGTAGGHIITVDALTGSETGRSRAPEGHSGVAIAAVDERTVVSSGDSGVMAWDVSTGEPLWTHVHVSDVEEACLWLAAAPVRDIVLCGSGYGVIEEYELGSGRPTGNRYSPQQGTVGTIAVASDGATMTTFAGEVPVISRWSLDGSGPVSRLIAPGRGAADGFTGDGSRLLTAVRSAPGGAGIWNTYAVWDVARNAPISALEPGMTHVAWFGDDYLAAFAGSSGLPVFIEADSGAEVGDASGLAGAMRVATGADRTRAIVTYESGFIQPWDVEALAPFEPDLGEPPNFFAGGWPAAVATSAGTDRIVVMTSGWWSSSSQVFDLRTGASMTGRVFYLEVPIIAPDGRVIAAVATDPGAVGRFDRDLQMIGTTHAAEGTITQLQMSADGSVFAAAGGNGKVAVFDTETGERIGGSMRTAAPADTQAFLSPDGQTLAVNVDQGIALWSLDPSTLAEAACRTAGRNLSEDEWSAYLADLGEWRATCPDQPGDPANRASS